MAFPSILFGPESEVFNAYSAVSPAPGNNGEGGPVAQRGRYPLGQQLVLPDGRKFRFALNGGSTLVVGEVQGSAAIITTDQSMTAVAAAVGARTISFVHGAATVVINYFAEGYAIISLTPGLAETYRIASHAALTSSGTDTVNLAPGHAVRTALTATSDISLLANPYAGVVVVAATIAQPPVGVAKVALTSGQFGWLQTRGPCGVICTGTMTIGSPAVMLLSGGTAGTPAPASAATQPQVGLVQMVEATGEASGLILTMDG